MIKQKNNRQETNFQNSPTANNHHPSQSHTGTSTTINNPIQTTPNKKHKPHAQKRNKKKQKKKLPYHPIPFFFPSTYTHLFTYPTSSPSPSSPSSSPPHAWYAPMPSQTTSSPYPSPAHPLPFLWLATAGDSLQYPARFGKKSRLLQLLVLELVVVVMRVVIVWVAVVMAAVGVVVEEQIYVHVTAGEVVGGEL